MAKLEDLINDLQEEARKNDKKKKVKEVEEDLTDFTEDTEQEPLGDDLLGDDVEETTPKKSTGTDKPPVKWWREDSEAEEYAKQRALAAQARKERYVPQFFLKPDEQATVVFVDDKGFGVNVHKVKVGDKWISLTCIKDFAPCPICATGNRSSYVIYYTVIDTRPYTDKDGKTTKFRKALFAATGSTLQMRIADEKKEQKGLVGAVCVFKRYSPKEASAGTLIGCRGKIDIKSKFGEENAKPIDYIKVLAPPTEEELESLGYNTAIVGSDTDILGDLDV